MLHGLLKLSARDVNRSVRGAGLKTHSERVLLRAGGTGHQTHEGRRHPYHCKATIHVAGSLDWRELERSHCNDALGGSLDPTCGASLHWIETNSLVRSLDVVGSSF